MTNIPDSSVSRKALLLKLEQEETLAKFAPTPYSEGILFLAEDLRIWLSMNPSTVSEGEAAQRATLETVKEALIAVTTLGSIERRKLQKWADSVEKEARQYHRERDEARADNEQLRAALKEVKRLVTESKGRIWTGVGICEVVDKALGSTSETAVQPRIRYTVSFILEASRNRVLLMEKTKGPYIGKLNGVGGKIEEWDASDEASAFREIAEETGLMPHHFSDFRPLTTMRFPSGVELCVFYGILHPGQDFRQIEDEPLTWYHSADLTNAADPRLAGEGNVAYFVNAILIDQGIKDGRDMADE